MSHNSRSMHNLPVYKCACQSSHRKEFTFRCSFLINRVVCSRADGDFRPGPRGKMHVLKCFFLIIPVPRSHTVRRRTVRKSEVIEMPSLPRGGGDDLVRDEQVSSRKVRRVRHLTLLLAVLVCAC